MGCGSGIAGQSRSAGVFVVSIIFSARTPGSITRESMAPRITAAMAAAITQRLVGTPRHFSGDVIFTVTVTWDLAAAEHRDNLPSRCNDFVPRENQNAALQRLR